STRSSVSIFSCFFLYLPAPPLYLPSFPTRRSSDLATFGAASVLCALAPTANALIVFRGLQGVAGALLTPASLAVITSTFSGRERDRKSTRLNSSHGSISYAVFCLKKKTKSTKHNQS